LTTFFKLLNILGSLHALIDVLNCGLVDINRQNISNNRTALHCASMGGHSDCIIALLFIGANPFLVSAQNLLARQVCYHYITS
jgi:ankyrin repeat protein